jgi:gamma-glutamylcyclotransferase (GGCT)/AIG2-like uncharacterized protein YtfP
MPSSAQSVEDDEFIMISSDDEKEVDESGLPASATERVMLGMDEVETGEKLAKGALTEGFMAGLKNPANMQAPKAKDESFSVRHRKISHSNRASLSMAGEGFNRKIDTSEAISKKFIGQNKYSEMKGARVGGTSSRLQYSKADPNILAAITTAEDTPFKPVLAFFYGTLMDPQTLQKVLGLPHEPIMLAAMIAGYKRMQFGHNAVLLPTLDDNVVQGYVYEIQVEDHYKRLDHYEGRHWRPVKCDINIAGSVEGVAGRVFIWGLPDQSALAPAPCCRIGKPKRQG